MFELHSSNEVNQDSAYKQCPLGEDGEDVPPAGANRSGERNAGAP